MSVTTAPARIASATPSPVDTDGLVVTAKIWPSPPVASTTARAVTAPTPSGLPSPSTCRVTPQARPLVVAEQIEHQSVLHQANPRVAADRRVQRPLHLGAGGVAARVHYPVGVMAALAGQHQGAVGVAVEGRTQLDQIANPGGAFADEDIDRGRDRRGPLPRPSCRARGPRGCQTDRARPLSRPAPSASTRHRC